MGRFATYRGLCTVLLLCLVPASGFAQDPAADEDEGLPVGPQYADEEELELDAPELEAPDAGEAEVEAGAPREVDEPDVGQPDEVQTAPADRPLQGKPIGKVSFTCDLPACQNPVGTGVFVEISGLYPGQPYSTAALRRAEERLAKTGFFEKLTVEKELRDDAVFLRIHGDGAVLIRKVQFRGAKGPPFESDLRKLLIYRQGQAYHGDSDRADAQLRSLRDLYESEGFFGTSVQMVVEEVEERPHQVDLLFRIEKGQQRRVCDVGFRGVKALTYAEARDLLLSEFGFFARRLAVLAINYTADGFKAGREALLAAYREQGYYQARILRSGASVEDSGQCVVLAVDVVEGPHWTLEFRGNERFDRDALVEQLPFSESGYVDREEIRRAERAMQKLYETRGYPFAQIEGEEQRADRLDRTIVFEIDEGPQLEIRDIRFHGNEELSDDELASDLGTQPYGLFETGGYLQTDQLLGDFGRIEEKYRKRGFLQATVDQFAVQVLEGDGLRIHVYIDEGEPTLVERVDVDGNRSVPDGTLLQEIDLSEGKPFVALTLKSDLSAILQKYASFGYPMARLETACRLLTGEKVACEAPRLPRGCLARTLEDLEGHCRWERGPAEIFICRRLAEDDRCVYQGGVERDRVHLIHSVVEGPQSVVGPILLKGNFDTESAVIYREIPLERGDLLDTRKVIEAQGNLRSLNLFDSVSVETIGLDEGVSDQDEATAALLINVEEARTREFETRFGLELRELFSDDTQFLVTGEAQYSNRNFWGRALGVQPRIISALDTLDIVRVAQATATDVELAGESLVSLDYLVGAELILSHPRFMKSLFGIDKLFATLSPFYLIDLLGVINRQVLREEGGVRVELRKELFEILARLYLKLSLEAKSIATFAPDGPIVGGKRLFSPRRTIGKVTPELALDRRDSPLNPTNGYLVRLEPSLVSGDATGRTGEDFVDDSFLRLTASVSFYIPLWEGDFVLGQAFRAGQVFPMFGRETPIQADERYFLGGVRSVRGFPEGRIGPVAPPPNQQSVGGEFLLNYNAELRYPIMRSVSLWGATFFDAGLLSDCSSDAIDGRDCYADAFPADEPFGNVRTTAGLGIRALLLDQIPVALDYGMLLNRQPGEKFGQVHFNVGYTFD